MTPENIISFLIFLLTASAMSAIGVSQLHSREPVGFYSGEKPPKAEDLTDAAAWNKKHGIMWLIYGAVIMISYGIMTFMEDSAWCILPICGGLILPAAFMMWYHNQLKKKYLK